MARLFTAVELTPSVRDAVVQSTVSLLRELDTEGPRRLRRVRSEHLHLTLVFLGEITEERVPAIIEAMSPPIALPMFDLTFTAPGTFPARGPARVLWLGIGEGREPLQHLHDEVGRRLERMGVETEARRFTPHLTLGRWPERGGPILRARLTATSGIPPLRVSAVTLFRSYLRPSGPEHVPLLTTTLATASDRLH